MDSLDLLFALAVLTSILVAVSYWWRFSTVLSPVDTGEDIEFDREILDLQERKDHLLEDLRDLELDFRMGKIAEAEYRQRKARVEPETVAVIRKLEALGVRLSPLDALVDDELDELDDSGSSEDIALEDTAVV
jgi:hypothetical protein